MNYEALSYKAIIHIEPNWSKIIQLCFPKIKNEKNAKLFINKLLESKKPKLNKEKSLVGKNIDLIEFYDSVSGFNFTWFVQDKTFISDLDMRTVGFLFQHDDNVSKYSYDLYDKFPKNEYIGSILSVSPFGINFSNGKKVSVFPYYEIMDILTNLHKYVFASSKMIKKFPEKIQEIFNENNIKYKPSIPILTEPDQLDDKTHESEWLKNSGVEIYDQIVHKHIFESPYCSISIDVEFFSPNDRDGHKLF